MSHARSRLMEIYQILINSFGPQNWWPGDTALEICFGAILTQNTNWKNAFKAIENLKNAEALDLRKIVELDQDELADIIRPSGYYNQKAMKLKAFCEFVLSHGENLEALADIDTKNLRNMLLAIKGIGPETADDMLLYAFDRHIFVVDTYTFRIFHRHGLLHESASYDEIADLFTSNLDFDLKLFSDYHALIVQVGKNYCKKTNPKCDVCPLKDDLDSNS